MHKPVQGQELVARLSAGNRVLALEARLTHLAAYDALSALLSRQPFQGLLEKEWNRSQRFHLPLTVGMIDIDFFKQINDSYGHGFGDEVIRNIASLIKINTRDCDIVCRYGGEEFCVLLPETNESAAFVWAERVRDLIAKSIVSATDRSLRVTVSIGLAQTGEGIENASQLLDTADSCLMAAKHAGRNRVYSSKSLDDSDLDLQSSANDTIVPVVRDAMTPLIHSVRDDWPISLAAEYILQNRVNAAPVINEVNQLLGMITDRGILATANGNILADVLVAETMWSRMITYRENTPLALVVDFLTRGSTRNAVVTTSSEEPIGIISRSSICAGSAPINTRRPLETASGHTNRS